MPGKNHGWKTKPPIRVTHPDIAAQAVDPTTGDLTAGSNKKVEWRCTRGHRWFAQVYARATKGYGCAMCSGKRVIPGETDLATLYPSIAAQLVDADPVGIAPYMMTKYTWECDQGHRWVASVANRTKRGSGCPVCSGHAPEPGVSDLATLRPDLAAQMLSPDPRTVTLHSARRARWRCEVGHEWTATINSRVTLGVGCSRCSKRVAIPGETDLATLHPEIAAQAVDTDCTVLRPGSAVVVLWECEEGHRWRTTVFTRTSGSGCPSCVRYGFDPTRDAVVYLLGRQTPTGEQRKIGITVNPKERLRVLKRTGWSAIDVSEPMQGVIARDIEQRFLRLLDESGTPRGIRPAPGAPADPGFTETWMYADHPVDTLQQVLVATAGSRH
jgi:hypothetical protein